MLLDTIERVGNRLPDPLTLFIGFAGFVVVASAVMAGTMVIHPGTGEAVVVQTLFAPDPLRRMLTDAVKNFAAFPPLGSVVTLVIGAGLCEGVGLFGTALKALVTRVPPRFLGAAVMFGGVQASLAGDAGFVVLVPLAGALYARLGRHPVLGIAAAFAGVAGGFSANLLLTGLDPLLSGLTTSAVQLLDPTAYVPATCNWWFMIASTFLLTGLGAWATQRFVAPRVGPWHGEAGDVEQLTALERRGLAWTGVTLLVTSAVLTFLLLPGGFLRDAGGTLKPFFDGLIAILLLFFLAAGLAYGLGARTLHSDRDVARITGTAVATLGGYIVLAFAIAQFVAYFQWSNLGLVVAVHGADALRATGVPATPMLVAFIVFSGTVDLLIGSASAKWAVMAPTFVPMFLLLDVPAAATQAAYRVGDSIGNMITPLNPYFPLLLAYARRWDPSVGIGTMIALMMPYAAVFGVGWVVMFGAWHALGIPFGF